MLCIKTFGGVYQLHLLAFASLHLCNELFMKNLGCSSTVALNWAFPVNVLHYVKLVRFSVQAVSEK